MSKPKLARQAPGEADEHLAAQAPEFRATLEQLRAIIRAIAPDCTERVSYKIPIFRLRKDFVAMSAAKKHIGLHSMSNGHTHSDEGRTEGSWHLDFRHDIPHQTWDGLNRFAVGESAARAADGIGKRTSGSLYK